MVVNVFREKPNGKYSFDWAKSIVSQAMASYPRAWEILIMWFDLSRVDLAVLLCNGSPKWNICRRWAHWIDDSINQWAGMLALGQTTKQVLSRALKKYATIDDKEVLAWLTYRTDDTTLDLQVVIGGAGGAEPPPGVDHEIKTE